MSTENVQVFSFYPEEVPDEAPRVGKFWQRGVPHRIRHRIQEREREVKRAERAKENEAPGGLPHGGVLGAHSGREAVPSVRVVVEPREPQNVGRLGDLLAARGEIRRAVEEVPWARTADRREKKEVRG